MSTQIVTVGLWVGAPFGGSIIRGIEELNTFIESENLDLVYEVKRIDHKKLPMVKDTPDILILDGGEDVNPARYREKNRYSSFNDSRDAAEFALVEHFSGFHKKLSGICRGHQLLNVYHGGSLWQDISNDDVIAPSRLAYHRGGHKVIIKRPSRLYPSMISKNGHQTSKNSHIVSRFVGKSSFTVSSMHHQAVNRLGKNLGVSLSFGGAKKSRGYIVEGIESSDGRVRGLQSHPEFNGYPKDGVLFSYLMHIDSFIDNLFEPDMKAIEDRLNSERPKKSKLPFDVQNPPPERIGNRQRQRRNVGLNVEIQPEAPTFTTAAANILINTTTAGANTWTPTPDEEGNGTNG